MTKRSRETMSFTLNPAIISYLETLPKGSRSQWVNETLLRSLGDCKTEPNFEQMLDILLDINLMLEAVDLNLSFIRDEKELMAFLRNNFAPVELNSGETILGIYRKVWAMREQVSYSERAKDKLEAWLPHQEGAQK